jgi:hypothetical protein
VAKQAGGKNSKQREAVQQQVKQWQSDANLAGLRDQTELAKLPEAKREAWKQFWTDVESLRKQARATKYVTHTFRRRDCSVFAPARTRRESQ